MNKKKVYVVGNATNYSNFIYDHVLVSDMENADLVIFTGGADVTPAIYGEKRNIRTSFDERRDKVEISEFEKARKLNKGIIGICRGSQLVTALSGGKLVQHVTNHAIAGSHTIRFSDSGAHFNITSSHHQMMNPFGINKDDYDLVAVSGVKRSTEYQGIDSKDLIDMESEPEIVFYKKTNSLAIQGHPEWMDTTTPVVVEINNLIDKYFYNE